MNSRCKSSCLGEPGEWCVTCEYHGMTDQDLFFYGLQQPLNRPITDHERFMHDNFPPGTIPPRSRGDGE